jgi:hypothetical protein
VGCGVVERIGDLARERGREIADGEDDGRGVFHVRIMPERLGMALSSRWD